MNKSRNCEQKSKVWTKVKILNRNLKCKRNFEQKSWSKWKFSKNGNLTKSKNCQTKIEIWPKERNVAQKLSPKNRIFDEKKIHTVNYFKLWLRICYRHGFGKFANRWNVRFSQSCKIKKYSRDRLPVERRRSKKSKVTKNNLRYSPYSHFSVINLLWDDGKLNSYITNFLIPVATAFKDHPALLAWEIMNEPEGIVYAGESDSEPGLFKISDFSCLTIFGRNFLQ